MTQEPITFSFGENWQSFLSTVQEEAIVQARIDIVAWLDEETMKGKTVIDIGSGSGLHSFAYISLGVERLLSFDYDPHSVAATTELYQRAGTPANWQVLQGSILDQPFVASLGTFDIVYSWGVLHHTGAMWQAIENAISMLRPGGLFWIAIYVKTPNYPQELALKQAYNRCSPLGKCLMEWKYIARIMKERLRMRKNPFAWNQKTSRGMNVYHDLVDWLGGLPYEVASGDEIIAFCAERGLTVTRTLIGVHANNIFLFKLPEEKT